MPFTVIVLKKVPNSLRGDLTRWMQEVSTGVYVGNYNAKVREYLWKRVTETVGHGEASMCYSCRNEIGYSFCTYNTERKVIDYDGIPLVLIPEKNPPAEALEKEMHGFSKAAKYYHAHRKVKPNPVANLHAEMHAESKSAQSQDSSAQQMADRVFLDIETTGLDADTDQIIEIGAIKITENKEIEFHRLIKTGIQIPEAIQQLTGITDEMLNSGAALEDSIRDFCVLIQGAVLIGYNIAFDIKFLNKAIEQFYMEPIYNKTIELMNEAKRKNAFQANYKFETTLKEYGINQAVPHRALEDAKLMHQLYKLMGFK